MTYIPRKFATNIGDGSTTEFIVEHHFGTRDVIVQVQDADTGQITISDITLIDEFKVKISVNTPLNVDQYRVVILG